MPFIGTSPAASAPGRRPLVPPLAAFAALVAVLVYLNALDNPFVYDDYRLIVENTSIQDPSNLRAILIRDVTRPVVNLSYTLDTTIWGRSPFGYHVTNVGLHAVNVVLVFWVVLLAVEDRRRQRDQHIAAGVSPTVAAFATALLFAVHPMLTEAVGYISGRSEVAYGFFFLLAFLAGRRWMLEGGRRWWVACVGLWVVAVFTKESAAMLPFVLLAYDWCVLDASGPERWRRFVKMGLPLLSLTMLAGAGRVIVLQVVEYDSTISDWRFALVAADAFWRYLGMFAVPRDQSIFHALPLHNDLFAPRALASVLGLMALPWVVWVLRRVHSLLGFGLLWFVLILVPSSALFILGIGEPMAEHRAYVAAVGLFLTWATAFAILWARVASSARWRRVVYAMSVLFIWQLGFRTVARNVIWSDPVLLSLEAARLAPDHWMPRVLLGEAYRQTGRCERAIPEYQAAVALGPKEEFPYVKLAWCLIEGRRLDEAEAALLRLQGVNPASQDAAMGLGVLATLTGRPGESRRYLLEALKQDPSLEQARLMLAFVEGTLPADQRLRMCEQLKAIALDGFDFEACVRPHRERPDAKAPSGP